MSKLTFKDILDSAIAELYGENAVELLKLFTTLNLKGVAFNGLHRNVF